VVENGLTIMRPARSPKSRFEKYIGALPVFSEPDEINAWVRALRDESD
jgi:hypothetical protein